MKNVFSKDILVIAPLVPKPDRASGDLRFYSILKVLAGQAQVTFLSLNQEKEAEAGRYWQDLRDLGIRMICEEISLRDIFAQEQYDAAFIEFYISARHCLDQIRILQPSCRVILDSVDIHFYREQMKYDLTNDEADRKKMIKTKQEELDVYRRSDLVIAVTREDAGIVEREIPGLKTDVIPNIHTMVETNEKRDQNALIFIGSFKHEPNIDAVKFLCEEIMPRVRAKRPDTVLSIIGGNAPQEILELSDEQTIFHGFVPDTTVYLSKAYISVAPLRFGAGMKGKVGEAMAHELPVVTSSIGLQGVEGLAHNENVLAADSADDFADCVLSLMQDKDLYHRIAKGGRQYIESNFTPEKVAVEITRIFDHLDQIPVKAFSIFKKIFMISSYVFSNILRKTFNANA